ncbi:sigma-70 family RNA polymerase sigma factor [Ilumatobacter nonamiensis]|uniref:sigma-70 family RNA polymerase sigma factor n=1 Tax=Ilumatobacter nonamiensis TaxID=467093 RepID=UPI000345DB34|nr:sigma-70 family RNA polymerase sigma factor [Ilumatobacter nonamiensis]
MASKLELSALVDRVVEGDREAFASIYDELAPMVFGVVKRVLRDPAMSEEVTQEVFVEIWSSIAKFDPDRASLSTWTVTIARRRAVDRVRREQSQRNRIEALAAQDDRNEEVGVDDEVVATAEAQRVRLAVAGLPDDQREVIQLAFIDGCAHGAIADRLNLPLGTVKGRVRGGLRRLRAELGSSGMEVER